jgi:bifunctional polynucleotide phosphatase/kinase
VDAHGSACAYFYAAGGDASLVQEIHDSGFKIVVFSNQALIKSALTGKGATQFKAKVDSVLKEAGVPAAVIAATMKDENRKPEMGMWTHFTEHCNGETKVDLKSSYYVGDAAGREYDFSDSDKQFAEAIGLPFKTPEDVFGKRTFAGNCCACGFLVCFVARSADPAAWQHALVNPDFRPNNDMASCLRALADVTQKSDEKSAVFKANAFRKAAASIAAHPEKIESAKEAGKLPGVGKGVQSLVTEFLETGKMGEAGKEEGEDKEDKDKPKAKEEKGAGKKSAGLAFL